MRIELWRWQLQPSMLLNKCIVASASPSPSSQQPGQLPAVGLNQLHFGMAPSSRTTCGAPQDPAVRPERPPLAEEIDTLLGEQRQTVARLIEVKRQIAATLKPTRPGRGGGESGRRRKLRRDPASGRIVGQVGKGGGGESRLNETANYMTRIGPE